jgi:hypothetical protein
MSSSSYTVHTCDQARLCRVQTAARRRGCDRSSRAPERLIRWTPWRLDGSTIDERHPHLHPAAAGRDSRSMARAAQHAGAERSGHTLSTAPALRTSSITRARSTAVLQLDDEAGARKRVRMSRRAGTSSSASSAAVRSHNAPVPRVVRSGADRDGPRPHRPAKGARLVEAVGAAAMPQSNAGTVFSGASLLPPRWAKTSGRVEARAGCVESVSGPFLRQTPRRSNAGDLRRARRVPESFPQRQ